MTEFSDLSALRTRIHDFKLVYFFGTPVLIDVLDALGGVTKRASELTSLCHHMRQ